MTRILSVERLSKSFGGLQAVADLSFDVEAGEILGIIGPNGAGKTTAVNLVSGVIEPTSGQVMLCGPATSPARRRTCWSRAAWCAPSRPPPSMPAQTVRENLLRGAFREIYPGLVATLLGTAAAREARARADGHVEEVMRWLDLERVADQVASSLPYGFQKVLGMGIGARRPAAHRSCSTSRPPGCPPRRRTTCATPSGWCASAASRSSSSTTTCASSPTCATGCSSWPRAGSWRGQAAGGAAQPDGDRSLSRQALCPSSVIEDLKVTYGPIVGTDGVALTLEAGETLALIGANGAGKSSTLKAILGMATYPQGRIMLDGADLKGLKPSQVVRRGVGYSPEGRRVFPQLSVLDNLRVGGITRATPPSCPTASSASTAISRASRSAPSQRAGSLSGGEQQMLAIGRALMSKPSLLMLDEPSLGLAPVIVERIGDILREMQATEGLAVLLAEQNATWALSLAKRAVILDVGRIRMTGDAAELLDDPAVRKAYLGV